MGALGALGALVFLQLKALTKVTGFLTMLADPATAIVVTNVMKLESFMRINVANAIRALSEFVNCRFCLLK